MKLNLGCGENKLEGYIGIDKDDYGQEIKRDLARGLPFSDETIESILAKHVLEHLTQEDINFVIGECWRVLKTNGFLEIEVPTRNSDEACVLEHKTLFSRETFVYSLCFKKWKLESILINNAQRAFVRLKKDETENKN